MTYEPLIFNNAGYSMHFLKGLTFQWKRLSTGSTVANKLMLAAKTPLINSRIQKNSTFKIWFQIEIFLNLK